MPKKQGKKRPERVKTFDQQLSEMPLEYLICMDLGHTWDPATLEVEYGDFQLGLVCSSDKPHRQGCGMERDRWRGPDGRFRNRYWHPKGDYGFRKLGRLDTDQRQAIRDTWQSALEPKLPNPEPR